TDDARRSSMKVRRRSIANARCASRSPTLDPSPMATKVGLLNPARRQDFPDTRADVLGSSTQQIQTSGERLFEEPFLFERLAEHHPQHAAVPGVGHRFDARGPAVDERLRLARVFLEDRLRS